MALIDSGGMDVNQRQRMIERFHARRLDQSLPAVERAVAIHAITSLLYMGGVRVTNRISRQVRERHRRLDEPKWMGLSPVCGDPVDLSARSHHDEAA